MSLPSSSPDLSKVPADLWANLATDLKQQVIFLMAQLAFNLLADQSHWFAKEPEHGHPLAQPIQQPQNPA